MMTTQTSTVRILSLALATFLALGIGACASNPDASAAAAAETADASTDLIPKLIIPAGQYAAAFDAAKKTLRDRGFLLERVDAQAGVITTQPKDTAGLATPWDREQSGIDQEFDDLFHRQQRVVRVEFTPASSAATPSDDLRTYPGDITARVQVAVLRAYQPGRRINTGNITSSTYTVDPKLEAQGLNYYSVAQKQDSRLAQRVLEAIASGTQSAEAAAQP